MKKKQRILSAILAMGQAIGLLPLVRFFSAEHLAKAMETAGLNAARGSAKLWFAAYLPAAAGFAIVWFLLFWATRPHLFKRRNKSGAAL